MNESITADTSLPSDQPKNLAREMNRALRPGFEFLEEIAAQVPRRGGKRRRSRLLLGLGRLLRVAPAQIIKAALGVELIHLATLIHDDVIDCSRRRRRQPTLHHLQGAVPALLYGDLLFARGISAVNSLRLPELTELLLETVRQLCSGEILESAERWKFDWSEETYLKIVKLKTAALFQYSCRAPGVLAGLSPEKIGILDRFGLDLGVSFQIADDCLDFILSARRSGKDRFADIRNGVPSLPLIYASRNPAFSGLLEEIFPGKIGLPQLEKLGACVISTGAVNDSLDEARRYLKRCRETAERISRWDNISSPRFLDEYIMEQGKALDSLAVSLKE